MIEENCKRKVLGGLVPDHMIQKKLSGTIKAPQVYAVAAGKEMCALENGCVPTLRLQSAGTREVVCANVLNLFDWFSTRFTGHSTCSS